MYDVRRTDFTMRIACADFFADSDKPRHDFRATVTECLCQAGVDINSQKLLRVKRSKPEEFVLISDWENNWHIGCCLTSCIVVL